MGEVYRIPNANIQTSMKHYDNILRKLRDKTRVIIGGDHNVDLLKLDSLPIASDLFDNLLANSFIPTITKPTRITHSSATLINNIFVNYDHKINIASGILISHISDHYPVFCALTIPKPNKPIAITRMQRKITESALEHISNTLSNIDWNYLDNMAMEESYSNFSATLIEILDRYAPLKCINISQSHVIKEPWMSNGLRKSSQTALKLYKLTIGKSQWDKSYTKYQIYRRNYKRIKREAKQIYYNNLFIKYKYDIKNTWRTINSILGKTNDKSSISDSFNIDGSNSSDPGVISDNFCKFFTTIGPTSARKINKSQTSYDIYLNSNKQPLQNSIFLAPTDPVEILTILENIKAKNSSGHDGITSKFLKSIKHLVAKPISILINKSIEQGKVPDSQKIVKVIPIYKAKSKDDFSNYRPISLLPTISKFLEKVIHKKLYHFFRH